MRFRRNPVEVEAVQFLDENWQEMVAFCGSHRDAHDEWDIQTFNLIGEYSTSENPEVKAECWNATTRTWQHLLEEYWVVKDAEGTFWVVTPTQFNLLYTEIRESNIVEHARAELELIDEDPDVKAGYLNILQAFADMGHSGGSTSAAIPLVNELFMKRNLAPLTDNPDEWQFHSEEVWGEPGGIWQSKRNGEAFSKDGGKTYWLLSDGQEIREANHISETYEPAE